MRISFIIPSRNNLTYLKQAVQSIQRCYQDQHDIVLLDDASTDGTWDWIDQLQGGNIIKYRNPGPDRQGHTILYDKGVELSKTEVFTIFHADMVTTTNHIPNLLKHLKLKTVVSATRVEPPLHPPGPEKLVKMFGFEPDQFELDQFNLFVQQQEQTERDKITEGIFAPWCMYKKDFQAIGGHDSLFAPMELEDSDIFNRMQLAGYQLVQARDSLVYHMTCRGSRFKQGLEIEAEIPMPDGSIWYKPKDSAEYLALRAIKIREWRRKWGSDVMHDQYMKPIVPPKYDIGFQVSNCHPEVLRMLEPWCANIYTDQPWYDYIQQEQPNTKFDLSKRVLSGLTKPTNDIIVHIDGNKLTDHKLGILQNLALILQDSGTVGTFQLEGLLIEIKQLVEHQQDLIYTDEVLHPTSR